MHDETGSGWAGTDPTRASDPILMRLDRLIRLATHKFGAVEAISAIVRQDGRIGTVAPASEASLLMGRLQALAEAIAPRKFGQHEILMIADPPTAQASGEEWDQGNSSFTACVAAPVVAGEGVASEVLCLLVRRPRAWSDPELESVKSLMAGTSASLRQTEFKDECPEAGQVRLLTAALEAANDVVLVTEADTRDQSGPKVVYVNPAFTRMTGYAPEEIIGKTPRILQGADTDPAAKAMIRDHLKKWKPIRVEILNYRKDGTPFWAELDIRPVADADGWYTHWVAVQRDVTERRKRDDEQRRSEAENRKLATVAKATKNAVIIADEGGHIEWVNDAFMRLSGYTLEEVIGRSPGSFLTGPDTDTHTTELMRSRVRDGEGFDLEVLNYAKDGRAYWVSIDCRPVRDGSNKLTGFIAVEVDITARRAHEEANKRLTTDLTQAYEATIEGWARALDLRDHETEGHSRRVTEMTMQLARAMGVAEEEIVHIRRGSLLHDIGKMGIPDAVLRKPGPLTASEWQVMREHPRLAKEMLESIQFLEPALDIPFGHHERWDGSGYPLGLRGKEIPLAARIFAVVDIWDALSNDRPYRRAWPKHKVIEYIKSQADVLLDPDAVSAFIRLFARETRVDVEPEVLTGCVLGGGFERISWSPAPKPEHESSRIEALYRYDILDSRPETAFDDLVRLAASICETPMATISLIDVERQWFKARVGVDADQTPRDLAFCAHTILREEATIVPDARNDSRFRGNPLVIGPPNIRFYAGVPLVESSGQALGTLCVLDQVPRELTAEKLELLEALSRQVVAQLELRRINNALTRERQALKADNARLDTLAATDGLTGLANRRRFDEALARFQKWSSAREEPLSILLADVDEFKAYNDVYGHVAGDDALRTMAELLKQSCRLRDLAARYGGEEFVVLLPGNDTEAAMSAALRIHAAVSAYPWPKRPLKLSIGVATMSPGGCSADLVARADAALYRAKSSGRDRVVVADAMEPWLRGHRRNNLFDELLASDASYSASA